MCNLERFQRCHQWKTRMDMQNLWQIFKKQIPPRSQANNLELDPIVDLFLDQAGKELYPIELMLISQIIPFMFKTAKNTGERWGLKVIHHIWKRVQTSLSRACNDDHLITLVLKQCLSDRGYVDKQVIRPGIVDRILPELIEVNPFY